MKLSRFAVVPLAASLAGFGFTWPGGGERLSVRTAQVTTQSVAKTLYETGTIEPVSAAAVAFPIAGKIASVAVKAGDTVTRGQALATLDTTSLQYALDAANATLKQAKLALATAREPVVVDEPRVSDAQLACEAIPECQAALAAALEGQTRQPSASSTPTAADLAALQKAIDAAEAGVAVANQNLAAATIVSPLDGTIESADFAVGDSVSAASATSVVKVVGTGGYEVTAIVAVDKLAQVKIGQPATVRVDGASEALTGEVVAIGAARTANGATSYPVSISLDDAGSLRNGTVASVAITTATANNALVVPTSAVRVEQTGATVTLLEDGKTRSADVVVGVIGPVWTQIKSGLAAGQTVVIADLNAALPGSATSASNGGGGGGERAVIFEGPPPGAGGAGPVFRIGE